MNEMYLSFKRLDASILQIATTCSLFNRCHVKKQFEATLLNNIKVFETATYLWFEHVDNSITGSLQRDAANKEDCEDDVREGCREVDRLGRNEDQLTLRFSLQDKQLHFSPSNNTSQLPTAVEIVTFDTKCPRVWNDIGRSLKPLGLC